MRCIGHSVDQEKLERLANVTWPSNGKDNSSFRFVHVPRLLDAICGVAHRARDFLTSIVTDVRSCPLREDGLYAERK